MGMWANIDAMDERGEDEATDEELIAQVLGGRKERFRPLVLRYQRLVYGLILRQLASHGDAEELSQEVFIQVFSNLKRFRGESKFSTWLTRITLNHISNFVSSTKFKRRQRLEEFTAEKHQTSDEQDPLESRQRMERYQRELLALKPHYREVVALCAFEGRSYEEVAAILKIPVGTVRSRLNQARHLLKAKLFEGEGV